MPSASLGLPRSRGHVKSTTYHDGKWVFVSVDSAKALSDIKQLLALKRPPKPGLQAGTRHVAPRVRARRPTRG